MFSKVIYSDLWNVGELHSLLFLKVDLYKVKELCHHRHCHLPTLQTPHHHHHYHSSCTKAMDKSPMHCMNNGMQEFLLSGTCCIPLQLPLEYARQHKVFVAGEIYHVVIIINIFLNRMKRWWGPKHCSHVDSICALYWAGFGLKSWPGDQLWLKFFFVFLLSVTWEILVWFFDVCHSQFLLQTVLFGQP
jgi:hypothetical protein